MLEVSRFNFSSFWETEILGCIVAKMVKNLKGFRRNVQHKKCSLACLVWTYKFLESLAKYKIDITLEDFGLTSVHLGRFLAHVMLAFHMHLEQGEIIRIGD